MKLAQSITVFVMFLIGAPLGAIIKKGGLGVPVLISIVFFVIYYISTIIGKKYAEEMVVSPLVGCWGGIGVLFLIGLFCLRQAYADARLFDFDYYTVQFNKLKAKFTSK
jgi:lipopolysaccharide export system permease protein